MNKQIMKAFFLCQKKKKQVKVFREIAVIKTQAKVSASEN